MLNIYQAPFLWAMCVWNNQNWCYKALQFLNWTMCVWDNQNWWYKALQILVGSSSQNTWKKDHWQGSTFSVNSFNKNILKVKITMYSTAIDCQFSKKIFLPFISFLTHLCKMTSVVYSYELLRFFQCDTECEP